MEDDYVLKLDPINYSELDIIDAFDNFDKYHKIKVDYLVGKCSNGHDIILFVRLHKLINFSILFKVNYIFEFEDTETRINQMHFYIDELNHIYNIRKRIEVKKSNDGTTSILIKSKEATNTKEIPFYLDEKYITCNFFIEHFINYGVDKSPLNLNSIMIFKFEETNDYEFLIKLYYLARTFIEFLCYRNNITINKIKLLNTNSDYFNVGELKSIKEINIIKETNRVLTDNYISFDLINDQIGLILQDFVDKKIYIRHIPQSQNDSNKYTAARFVLITAAFEWEFDRKYPDGIKHEEETIQARKLVKEHLKEQKAKTSGKVKEVYKTLLRNVDFDNLASKFNHVYIDLMNIFGNYPTNLFKKYDEQFDYKKSGQRLAEQRNNFAHGKLKQEFIGSSLLDIILLERILYIMQLSHYNISNENIMKAVKQLFGEHF